jgi:hypothetical protein
MTTEKVAQMIVGFSFSKNAVSDRFYCYTIFTDHYIIHTFAFAANLSESEFFTAKMLSS